MTNREAIKLLKGVAYIFDDGSNIEYIGKAVLVEKRDEE